MAVPSPKPAGRAHGVSLAIPKPPGRAAKAAGPLALVTRDPAALLREWVDELGALDSELVEIRPKLKRVETLRALIRERFEAHPAQTGLDVRGARYLATLGPRAYQSTVDYAAVKKALGLKAYAEIAEPTLKALEAALAPDVLARVVSHGYTGARPVKTFQLSKAGR
jgi:hypothetical protein